jgi:glycerate kinase
MNILISSDSFKHSLSSREAGKSIAEGIKSVLTEAGILILPLADGGEGTVQALTDATGGNQVQVPVHDPLMRKIMASFGILGDDRTAVIEMAAASGVELLNNEERNPLRTTSYGTGEFIRAAMDHQCNRIILGIGGSATIDGGAGLMAALGVRFYNQNNETFIPTGGNLGQIKRIDTAELDYRLQDTRIKIGTDVNNPLTGEKGAAIVYGPQKGASTDKISELEESLSHYADLLKNHTGKDFKSMPGTGAAGGLAISLLAFTNAALEKGFNLIAKETGLEEQITKADLIITGEGKIDSQTAFGKTAYGVAQIAKKYNKPLIAVAGTLERGYEELYKKGFDLILPATEGPTNLDTALQEASRLLANTGIRIGHILKLNNKIRDCSDSS